jgi:hypothetical protein
MLPQLFPRIILPHKESNAISGSHFSSRRNGTESLVCGALDQLYALGKTMGLDHQRAMV